VKLRTQHSNSETRNLKPETLAQPPPFGYWSDVPTEDCLSNESAEEEELGS